MRTLIASCVVFASGMVMADCSYADGPDAERNHWQARVAKIRIGMTRAEVERLLPPYQAPGTYGGVTTIGSGGCQANPYYVSPGWQVSVCYDHTGIPRDANGRAEGLETRYPDNRVLGPVTLKWNPVKAPVLKVPGPTARLGGQE